MSHREIWELLVWVWLLIPVILAPGSWMQENHEFQANLGNTARSCPGTNDECGQVVGGEYAFAQILNLPFSHGWTWACFLCSGSASIPVCIKEANKVSCSKTCCDHCAYADVDTSVLHISTCCTYQYMAILFNMNFFRDTFYFKGLIQKILKDKCIPIHSYTIKNKLFAQHLV